MRRTTLALVVAGSLASPALRLAAQTNDDINSGLQFNFSTPGARSLAMGGAFLAVADDATAAYTNPAGLTSLLVGGSEASLELRQWRYQNRFTAGGHAFGEPSGVGLDTVSGLQRGEFESEVSGLSFLSAGYVLPRSWTVAVYRHELANFSAGLVSEGPFLGSGRRAANGERDLFRVFPARSTLDLEITNYGVSGARQLGKVAVGLGLCFYQFELASKTERFFRGEQDFDGDRDVEADDDARSRQPGGFFGHADWLGDNVFNVQSQEGSDTDVGVNLGLLWAPNEKWSFGAAYRQGPDFAMRARYVYGPRGPDPGQSASPNLCSPGRTRDCLGGTGALHVPDVFGVGAAWTSPSGHTKISLDYDRVRYSQLTRDLLNILARETRDFDRRLYRIEDGNEVHLGFENILAIGAQLVATLRLGAWYDPAHSMEYLGTDEALRARFLEGEDAVHSAAGVGLVIKESLQVDVALELSERARIASLSLVKFF